ncbi:hypothetical protein HDU89_008265 [Geranomyces variabilis]|nr:hypothetical protein HDU89_008265 [Geranomyces variabilis]
MRFPQPGSPFEAKEALLASIDVYLKRGGRVSPYVSRFARGEFEDDPDWIYYWDSRETQQQLGRIGDRRQVAAGKKRATEEENDVVELKRPRKTTLHL